MQIEKRNQQIIVSGLSASCSTIQELQSCFKRFSKELSAKNISGLIIDLNGLASSSYQALTFIISAADLASSKNLKISLIGLDNDKNLKNSLEKLGFSHDAYTPKQFREETPESLCDSLGDGAYSFFSDFKKLIGFTGDVFLAIFKCIRHPGKLDLREVIFYMDRSGADAVPIVIMICFLVGLILGLQGIMQMGKFGLEIYVADLVALSIVRELGPLMVGMICIGRAGSAYAAELGTMKVAEEIDAMSTMGLKPARFLVLPKIIALVAAMPMLVIIGNVSGIIGGVIIGVSMSDVGLIAYVNRTLEALIPANLLESIVKSLFFALIIAAVGCFRGFEAERDAKGVGNATTSSVVTGIFLVVVADFLITFTFPQVMALFGVDY